MARLNNIDCAVEGDHLPVGQFGPYDNDVIEFKILPWRHRNPELEWHGVLCAKDLSHGSGHAVSFAVLRYATSIRRIHCGSPSACRSARSKAPIGSRFYGARGSRSGVDAKLGRTPVETS